MLRIYRLSREAVRELFSALEDATGESYPSSVRLGFDIDEDGRPEIKVKIGEGQWSLGAPVTNETRGMPIGEGAEAR